MTIGTTHRSWPDGRKERETRRRNYVVWIYAPYHRGLLANCDTEGGLLVTNVIQRAGARGDDVACASARQTARGGRDACRLCLGVYLGRDMKNASNGPWGTSPFKSTAILLPTCHHFSDQKLPAHVTFPCAVYQHSIPPPAPSTSPSPSVPPFRPGKASAYLPLNKACETLLHTGASPAYVFTRCDVGTLGTYLHGRETFPAIDVL